MYAFFIPFQNSVQCATILKKFHREHKLRRSEYVRKKPYLLFKIYKVKNGLYTIIFFGFNILQNITFNVNNLLTFNLKNGIVYYIFLLNILILSYTKWIYLFINNNCTCGSVSNDTAHTHIILMLKVFETIVCIVFFQAFFLFLMLYGYGADPILWKLVDLKDLLHIRDG